MPTDMRSDIVAQPALHFSHRLLAFAHTVENEAFHTQRLCREFCSPCPSLSARTSMFCEFRRAKNLLGELQRRLVLFALVQLL